MVGILDVLAARMEPPGINGVLMQDYLRDFPAFKTWKTTLQENLKLQWKDENHAFHKHPFTLQSIEIQSVDWFGRKIGFIKLKAIIKNDEAEPKELPGVAFLRGGSVAMLMILRPKDSRDERLVVMTEQPRIPAGSLSFLEIPAGMIDDGPNFKGKAADEILEETGFNIPVSELIDMTKLALSEASGKETNHQQGMYPSPGGSDEFIHIFLWEKEIDRQEVEDLRGKLTGQKWQGEMITLRVCDNEDLWRECARDAKTLAAWALYEGLNRAGIIPEILRERRERGTSPEPDGREAKRQKKEIGRQ
ncbi:NUDIX family hydrolase-like protein [Pseudomassariella vexata]|uniref:NUDIX family hydrolase-like protein n=1 Tax=Pseudomassariella vexata TaxID=1141098 RepID=A0A1Y2EKA7_9PEZI|nr:NUDIX family hydrolase-like protein [Pseudomassariella vexata]ORY71275.1 NUDIX family hydrolase-like protein [Pseudomassariella vexata]